ncbi:hypothetical protein B0H14DRAFT_3131555 [Mycena olivaceomarginata]|nr:hypothetical protein B0H14DRAFT_3131555 [Mycena olivaceomarginata]
MVETIASIWRPRDVWKRTAEERRPLPPVRRLVLRVYVGLRLIFSSPTPPAPGSALPIYSTSIIVAPLRGGEPHETHRSALPPQVRRGVGVGKAGRRNTGCISAGSSQEDERRARRALRESTQDSSPLCLLYFYLLAHRSPF